MTDIRAGDEISKDWWPASVVDRDFTEQADISSATYVTGSPVVDVLFVAPLSGRVVVALQAGIDQDSAGNRALVSYQMYEGTSASGTLVQAPRDEYGVSSPGSAASDEMVQGNMSMVAGLTPGATHYARVVHRVDAGTTNDVTFRELIVFPVP